MVLWYKTYLEWTLLTVSSLGKQDLILEFTWLKIYNPEVDWQEREVVMACCSLLLF